MELKNEFQDFACIGSPNVETVCFCEMQKRFVCDKDRHHVYFTIYRQKMSSRAYRQRTASAIKWSYLNRKGDTVTYRKKVLRINGNPMHRARPTAIPPKKKHPRPLLSFDFFANGKGSARPFVRWAFHPRDAIWQPIYRDTFLIAREIKRNRRILKAAWRISLVNFPLTRINKKWDTSQTKNVYDVSIFFKFLRMLSHKAPVLRAKSAPRPFYLLASSIATATATVILSLWGCYLRRSDPSSLCIRRFGRASERGDFPKSLIL